MPGAYPVFYLGEVMAQRGIVPVYIEDEMKRSYIDYAMSVIIGRALPDLRDGFKPVHRRILYAMRELGLFHNKPFKKSASVVGEVLGKYHPHGDMAVYDALVRMVQDFSLRYPLIEGQGNFGSIDGDSAAAYRYTEVRLSPVAEAMLEDIEKDTVPFVPNFDERLKEPAVLPSKFPNILVNGATGIAVGMATNIPPHNLREVIDSLCTIIDNPETENLGISGPDFPTGGIIVGTKGIKEAYETGRGKIVIRARTHIEENRGRKSICITEIPYQVNKSNLIEKMASLVREKKLEGISGIRDESDREGMRIVVEVKKGANEEVILNQLYKHTQLREVYGIILLLVHNGVPKIFNLRELLCAYLEHRYEVVKKRTEFNLNKAEKRAHILEGLKIALENIDEVVNIIKKSKDTIIAKQRLMKRFQFSDLQAQAILDMKLSRLVGLERKKLNEEYLETIKLIEKLKAILATRRAIMGVVKDELIEIKEKFGDFRRTRIVEGEEQELSMEDFIADEDMVVTLTKKGYIKRLSPDSYRTQIRGGTGFSGVSLTEQDRVSKVLCASCHSYLLAFTDKGRCYSTKIYEIPRVDRQGKGRPIANIIPLQDNEMVADILSVKNFSKFIIIATRGGTVKKMQLSLLQKIQRPGIRVSGFRGVEDTVIGVQTLTNNSDILLITRKGKAIRFDNKELRAIGRTAHGVRGIRLMPDDELIGVLSFTNDKGDLFLVSADGYGKRTRLSKFRKTKRGGKGIIAIKVRKKVAGWEIVELSDEIIVTTRSGKTIRTMSEKIRTMGRGCKGVRIIRVQRDDEVISVGKV
jgi:DNA gyrase subunit A